MLALPPEEKATMSSRFGSIRRTCGKQRNALDLQTGRTEKKWNEVELRAGRSPSSSRNGKKKSGKSQVQ
jgi:hypothetical protein